MFFSSSSLISVIFFCNLLIVAIWFYLYRTERMVRIGIKIVFILMGFVVVRLFFPLEFDFSNSLASEYIMPNFLNVLHMPIINVGSSLATLSHFLLFIWIIGIIFTATETINEYLRFSKMLKQMPVVQDPIINQLLSDITQTYKKPLSFQIIYSDCISTPMLYGFRRPKIIAPNIYFTNREWYFILSHEIAHYYNRDLQIKIFVQLLRIFYWWNPFVYLLNNEINKMLEIRTDFIVTKSLNEYEKIEYLDCLLRVAKGTTLNKHNKYLVTFNGGKTSLLSQRFYLVLGKYKNTKSKYLLNILMIIPIVLLLYFSFFVVIEPYAIHPYDATDTIELTEDSSYLIYNPARGYDVYINHSYFATVKEIKDSYSHLTIYPNLEEAKNHEIHK